MPVGDALIKAVSHYVRCASGLKPVESLWGSVGIRGLLFLRSLQSCGQFSGWIAAPSLFGDAPAADGLGACVYLLEFLLAAHAADGKG